MNASSPSAARSGFCKCLSARMKPPQARQAHLGAALQQWATFLTEPSGVGPSAAASCCLSVPLPLSSPVRDFIYPTHRRFVHALHTMRCSPIFPQVARWTSHAEARGVLSTQPFALRGSWVSELATTLTDAPLSKTPHLYTGDRCG